MGAMVAVLQDARPGSLCDQEMLPPQQMRNVTHAAAALNPGSSSSQSDIHTAAGCPAHGSLYESQAMP